LFFVEANTAFEKKQKIPKIHPSASSVIQTKGRNADESDYTDFTDFQFNPNPSLEYLTWLVLSHQQLNIQNSRR
jgi:hypothetical protein